MFVQLRHWALLLLRACGWVQAQQVKAIPAGENVLT